MNTLFKNLKVGCTYNVFCNDNVSPDMLLISIVSMYNKKINKIDTCAHFVNPNKSMSIIENQPSTFQRVGIKRPAQKLVKVSYIEVFPKKNGYSLGTRVMRKPKENSGYWLQVDLIKQYKDVTKW